jgi:hypothetical protein
MSAKSASLDLYMHYSLGMTVLWVVFLAMDPGCGERGGTGRFPLKFMVNLKDIFQIPAQRRLIYLRPWSIHLTCNSLRTEVFWRIIQKMHFPPKMGESKNSSRAFQ